MGPSEQQGHCPHEGGERLAREQQQKTVADATPIDEIRQPKQHSRRADHRGHDFGAKRHARIVDEAGDVLSCGADARSLHACQHDGERARRDGHAARLGAAERGDQDPYEFDDEPGRQDRRHAEREDHQRSRSAPRRRARHRLRREAGKRQMTSGPEEEKGARRYRRAQRARARRIFFDCFGHRPPRLANETSRVRSVEYHMRLEPAMQPQTRPSPSAPVCNRRPTQFRELQPFGIAQNGLRFSPCPGSACCR